ncbi:MAG: hypothetical protein SGCHY_000127 [Lobulomycetales sp.]
MSASAKATKSSDKVAALEQAPQKFAKLASSISQLENKVKIAQMDFEETQNISLDLENQVAQRSQECTALEDENKSLKLEIADLVQSIERLMIEREEMESKIDSVKMENTKLDAILQTANAI